MGDVRRSCTSQPTDMRPEMRQRLIMRDEWCVSRLVMTTRCGSKEEPYACPSLSANSGVTSMFAMPLTPSPPKSDPGHFVPQTSDMETTLPAETNLSGQSLTCGLTFDPASSVQRLPTTAPSPIVTSSLMMACSAIVHAESRLRLPT